MHRSRRGRLILTAIGNVANVADKAVQARHHGLT